MKASVVLGPVAAKRLIAKGVRELAVVKNALAKHTIIITLGTTNAMVAEELLGQSINKQSFAAGFIDGRFNVNKHLGEMGEVVIREGIETKIDQQELLKSLTAGDVIIKGGNAIDPWGHVGVLMSSRVAGTVGRYYAAAVARGVDVVIPISLQKAIHTSVEDLTTQMGTDKIELSMGLSCGMHPLAGQVVTEIDTLERLFPVQVTHIASGGVGCGAGSISLLITGQEKDVRNAFELVRGLASEREVLLEGQA
jgi:hypothetical protein